MAIEEKKGNSSKNKKYLAMMKRRTLSKTHPRNMGVRMQAHHVLSGEGVKQSKLGAKLVKFGYDINTYKNLAFIPSTLQGACYLGVQPHIGNHSAPGLPEVEATDDDYIDDAHSRDYHQKVSDALKDEAEEFPTTCEKGKKGNNVVTDQMDALALVLLERIQNAPARLPLTSAAEHFKRRSKIGCGGHDSVPDLNGNPVECKIKRQHKRKQNKDQRSEFIRYDSDGKFKLVMGQ